MAKKPETKFRDKVVRHIKQLPNTFIMSVQQRALRGSPDLICCVNGLFIALELKASQKAPVSALQNYFLDRISEAGGIAFVCYPENWDAIKKALEILSKGLDEEKVFRPNQG